MKLDCDKFHIIITIVYCVPMYITSLMMHVKMYTQHPHKQTTPYLKYQLMSNLPFPL